MLPFLTPQKTASVAKVVATKSGESKRMGNEDETNHELLGASEDLIRAVHAKDAKAVACALQAGFACCGKDQDDKEPALSWEDGE